MLTAALASWRLPRGVTIGALAQPEAFTFPCLSRLQPLTIRTDPRDHNPYHKDYTGLLSKIIDNLQQLRQISFVHVRVDISNLQCLSRLRALRSLTWVLGPDDENIERGKAEAALAKAFESLS